MRPSSFTSITLLGLVLWLASMSSGHTQTLEWVTQAGGPLSDRGSGIAIDSNGNSYVTGDFEGSATFGLGEPNQTTLIDSNGLGDIFVAKYDPSGALVWVTQAGGPGIDRGVSIAVDSSGNSYVRGVFRQTATFGAITLTSIDGSFDIFVAKYDPNGALVWVRQVGGPDIDAGRGIAVDSSGNSYVVGSFLGTTSFGGIMLTSAGPGDIFVAKYNSSGTLVWVRQAGGTGLDNGVGIAVDSSGNSYVTGRFAGTASFGATVLTSTGSIDIFVAKYDSNGTLVQVIQDGATGGAGGLAVGVDSSDNIYVTGIFFGTATFGTPMLTSAGSGDIFVAKYDSSGALVWATQAGGTGIDSGQDIAVDSSGNSYVTGSFVGTATFGATMLTGGRSEIFVAKYVNNTPPVAQCQAVTVSADNTCQATVTASQVDNGSSDPDNDPLTFSLTPAAPFSLGTTSVTLTVTDSAGASSQCNATVTVVDTTAPSIICPADQVVSATSAVGVGVTYAPTAADNCPLTVACAPPSGSTFPIGTTPVSCMVTDSGDLTASCTFAVTVETTDLSVTKAAPATLLLQIGGQANLTYTIGVKNIGPGVADGVVMTDPLPNGTTFVSASASQGSCSTPTVGSGGTVNCTVGTLPNGASATITLVAKVRRSLLTLKTLTNTATVSAGTYDPNSANNAATAKTTVVTVLTR